MESPRNDVWTKDPGVLVIDLYRVYLLVPAAVLDAEEAPSDNQTVWYAEMIQKYGKMWTEPGSTRQCREGEGSASMDIVKSSTVFLRRVRSGTRLLSIWRKFTDSPTWNSWMG
jgi:hypothetical protein